MQSWKGLLRRLSKSERRDRFRYRLCGSGRTVGLMMPHSLGAVTAAIACGFGLKRSREAFDVYSYQRGLKFTKMTRVAPHLLPVTKEHLYLGEGFEWTQLHTQRKLDTQQKKVEEYVKPSLREMRLAAAGENLRKWTDKKSDSLLRSMCASCH
jgi:hypothetical protein